MEARSKGWGGQGGHVLRCASARVVPTALQRGGLGPQCERHSRHEERGSPSNVKAGRNDPCPCGSGRKYKKCCLPEDEGLEVAVPKGNARPPGPSRGAPNISPYAAARIVEQAVTDGRIGLSRKERRALRDKWTISKVASMTTEAIEEKVRRLGIPHTRERLRPARRGP